MAKKRLFDREFCLSDEFTERLSAQAKLAYFAICLETDDEGFCENPVKTTSVLCNCSRKVAKKLVEDLEKAGYILQFPEKTVVLVTHYWVHNNQDRRNAKATRFSDLRSCVTIENRVYKRISGIADGSGSDCSPTDSRLQTDGGQTDSSLETDGGQTGISLKDNIIENNTIEEKRRPPDCNALWILFKAAWPNKEIENELEAYQAFSELSPTHDLVREMIQGIENQKNSPAADKFPRDLTAWIREHRWQWKQKRRA